MGIFRVIVRFFTLVMVFYGARLVTRYFRYVYCLLSDPNLQFSSPILIQYILLPLLIIELVARFIFGTSIFPQKQKLKLKQNKGGIEDKKTEDGADFTPPRKEDTDPLP
jgi:hypothetical protein